LNKEGLKKAVKKHRRLLLFVAVLLGALLIIIPKSDEQTSQSTSLAEYKAELEEELEDMLSEMEGVGKCSVNVTFSDGERYTYSGSRVISVTPPRVLGVGVVCEGGGSAGVSERITEAIAALFDIGANRICVVKMKK
jgi:stage III sporulation protein AG